MSKDDGCFTVNGREQICDSTTEQCCEGLGCVVNTGGACCGPNFYFMLRKFTEYCSATEKCCSNTISATCCDIDMHCCTDGDSVTCCNTQTELEASYDTSGDWWLWFLFAMMFLLLVVIVVTSCFEESAPGYGHARRLSDWYNERYRQEEMIMLSQHRQQEPNPPLYQTIVPPTYQYQKPPTPIEPPPKYEESMGSGAGPPSPASGRFPVDPVESSSPSAETSDGQPEYSRRGKVKKTRVSPLLKQIRSLEGRKLLTSGHNIFVRKNDSTCDANDSNDIVHQPDEALVYEFRAQPVNPFEVQ